jgi:hypothetical protein
MPGKKESAMALPIPRMPDDQRDVPANRRRYSDQFKRDTSPPAFIVELADARGLRRKA